MVIPPVLKIANTHPLKQLMQLGKFQDEITVLEEPPLFIENNLLSRHRHIDSKCKRTLDGNILTRFYNPNPDSWHVLWARNKSEFSVPP